MRDINDVLFHVLINIINNFWQSIHKVELSSLYYAYSQQQVKILSKYIHSAFNIFSVAWNIKVMKLIAHDLKNQIDSK